MTTTESIYQIFSGHHEMTSGHLLKKCLGQKVPGITNSKSISNALTRLKKDGRAESTYDADKGLWLWRAVKAQAGDHFSGSAEMVTSEVPTGDDSVERDPGEIAPGRDAAEIDMPDPLRTVTTPNVVNHDAECRGKPRKPRKPYTPNPIAGAYSYRGALVIKLDRKASARSITLSARDMAMLVAIHGNMS
jgi:hypothetical protein